MIEEGVAECQLACEGPAVATTNPPLAFIPARHRPLMFLLALVAVVDSSGLPAPRADRVSSVTRSALPHA